MICKKRESIFFIFFGGYKNQPLRGGGRKPRRGIKTNVRLIYEKSHKYEGEGSLDTCPFIDRLCEPIHNDTINF